jgi:MFS transporter, DHA2 family, multidrug resistance protein
MDLTVLHLAVPHISADLRPSSAQMLWIVDIYGFVVAGCLITMPSTSSSSRTCPHWKQACSC